MENDKHILFQTNLTFNENEYNENCNESLQKRRIKILEFFNNSENKKRNKIEIYTKFGSVYKHTLDTLLNELIDEKMITPFPLKLYVPPNTIDTILYNLTSKGELSTVNKWIKWIKEPENIWKLLNPIFGFGLGMITYHLTHKC